MSRLDFYHLQSTDLDHTLPLLAEKAYKLNKNIIIKIGTAERVPYINTLLWTYRDDAFLPHGSSSDGNASLQPIWLTSQDDNPNNASLLFLVDGADYEVSKLAEFERVFYIFDGNDVQMVQQARDFWKSAKALEMDCFYWQQDTSGHWQQK